MERYSRILTITERQFQKDCPLIFEKGALLKDNKENRNILQLQFKNIGLQKISTVFVSIKCFDIEKQEVEIVENKYLDLSVGYNECFGEKVPIILSNDSSRTFEVSVGKIVFFNNNIAEYYEVMKNIPDPSQLDELGLLKEQFIREVQKIDAKAKINVKPSMMDGIWICACGAINSNNNHCGSCDFEKIKLFPLLDIEYLKEKNEEYLKQKEEEEKERKRLEEQKVLELQIRKQENEEKQKKLRKKLVKIALVLLLMVAVGTGSYFLSVNYFIPSMKYSSAIEAIENGNYDEAYTVLTALGDFKDSSEQILAGKYKQSLEFVENKDYEQAYKILEELGDYSDAKEQILIAKYKEGNEAFENGEYNKAVAIFEEISDYSDSKNKRDKARLSYIEDFIGKKNYYRAIEELIILKKSDRSTKVDELLQECYYQHAESLYEQKNYKQAVQYYQYVRDYERVKDKIWESKYLFCKNSKDINDYTTSTYLAELMAIGYKDSKNIYKNLTKLEAVFWIGRSENVTYDVSSLGKYDTWYFNVKITNGEKDKKYNIKYTLTYPDGSSDKGIFKGASLNQGFYVWSENGGYISSGTATFSIYSEGGELLCKKSVKIN